MNKIALSALGAALLSGVTVGAATQTNNPLEVARDQDQADRRLDGAGRLQHEGEQCAEHLRTDQRGAHIGGNVDRDSLQRLLELACFAKVASM